MATYKKFDRNKPNGAVDDGAATLTGINENEQALLDAVAGGIAVDWNLSILSPGPEPADVTIADADDANHVQKLTITWGTSGGASGNPVTVVQQRSYDGGSTWTDPKTCTIAWNASGDPVSATWS